MTRRRGGHHLNSAPARLKWYRRRGRRPSPGRQRSVALRVDRMVCGWRRQRRATRKIAAAVDGVSRNMVKMLRGARRNACDGCGDEVLPLPGNILFLVCCSVDGA